MAETCDEPNCTNVPIFTMNIFRRQPAGVVPHFQSTYHDVCADHAVFKAIHAEDWVRTEPFSVLSNHRLWKVVKQLSDDYPPWGQYDPEARDIPWSDCSAGCKFFGELRDQRGADWGICASPLSHRSGLLTWEHQGCKHFETTPEED